MTTYTFTYVCKDEVKTYWTEKLELVVFGDSVTMARYFYLHGNSWDRQTKRKLSLKIKSSKKGKYIIFHKKRCYLKDGNGIES